MNAGVRIGGRGHRLGNCPDGKVTLEQTTKGQEGAGGNSSSRVPLHSNCRMLGASTSLTPPRSQNPGEVFPVRPCDVDRSAEVWIYSPEHHKLRGGRPQCPDASRSAARGGKFLLHTPLRSPNGFCLSPREAEATCSRQRRLARKSACVIDDTLRGRRIIHARRTACRRRRTFGVRQTFFFGSVRLISAKVSTSIT
jgi:hypothetical protein